MNAFVGKTANNRARIIQERLSAALGRFQNRCLCDEEDQIKKIVVVGEDGCLGGFATDIMMRLGYAGVPEDVIVVAGNAKNTFEAIELFVTKVTELYPGQHVRVHVATHEWLLPRTLFYMGHWKPNKSLPPPALKMKSCCPCVGYQPNLRERLREFFRRGDAGYILAQQRDPLWWHKQQQLLDPISTF
ncbi:MAG: hypothetical protein KIH67_003995 [Candidatus Moranbacteria bacterium]|nr:hypothetical protein [Candidatus Moranbacteria bacterium]